MIGKIFLKASCDIFVAENVWKVEEGWQKTEERWHFLMVLAKKSHQHVRLPSQISTSKGQILDSAWFSAV